MIAVAGGLIGDPSRPDGVAGLAGRIAVEAAAGGSVVELIARVGDDPPGDALLLALNRAGVGHAAVLRDPALATPLLAPPAPASAGSAGSRYAVAAGDGAPVAPLADEPADGGAFSDEESHTRSLPGSGSSADPAPGLRLRPEDLDLALRYLTDLSVVVLADAAAPGLASVAAEGAAFAGAAMVVIAPPGWTAETDGLPADATILVAPDDPSDGSFAGLVAEYAVALDGGRSPSEAWAAATGRLGAEPA